MYNMTKILTRKCSIPNTSGDIKQNVCDFNVIHACQMDIEMYNFVHNVFNDFRSGKFKVEAKLAREKKTNDQMFSKVLKERIDYIYMEPANQIDDDLTRRCNSDIMNNYFIEIAARSFTDIEDILFSKFENQESLKTEATIKEITTLKGSWNGFVRDAIKEVYDKLDR